jgi:hypothetical protein
MPNRSGDSSLVIRTQQTSGNGIFRRESGMGVKLVPLLTIDRRAVSMSLKMS